MTREERQDKLEDLLEEFHIQHIRTSAGMALSGGVSDAEWKSLAL